MTEEIFVVREADDKLAVTLSDDPGALAANWLRSFARPRGLFRKRAHLALSGGSTPRRAYGLARAADWSRATVWFADDRAVPPDDVRSNFRLVKETLDPPDVRRIEGELGAEAAAARYEEALSGVELDLVLLGIGPDGHTASLFPGRPEVEVTGRNVVAVPEAGMEPYVPRVSLTLEAINSARTVVFLIAGEDKAEVVQRVFRDRDESLPAARVKANMLLTDRAAWGA